MRTTLCWQSDAHLHCALHSDDAEVIERARLVLVPHAPKILAHEEDSRHADLQWLVERPLDGEPWHADSLTDETPALECETLDQLLLHIEYSALQALLARGTDSFFALHAALLSKEGHSIVLVGPKEAGKSTLSCALWARSGWHLECDDSVLLDNQSCARPNPRRVSLRSGSRELLGDNLWTRLRALPSTLQTSGGLLFHPHELHPAPADIRARLPSAVFFLARREGSAGPAQAVPIVPALAALALLPYSTFLLPRGEELLCPSRVEWGESLPRLTNFVNRVPVFDLGRGSLDDMTRTIESLVFHANPVSASAS